MSEVELGDLLILIFWWWFAVFQQSLCCLFCWSKGVESEEMYSVIGSNGGSLAEMN